MAKNLLLLTYKKYQKNCVWMVALKNQNQCFKTFFLHFDSLMHGGHPHLKKCETKP